jgi:hypothetical protein
MPTLTPGRPRQEYVRLQRSFLPRLRPDVHAGPPYATPLPAIVPAARGRSSFRRGRRVISTRSQWTVDKCSP